MNDFILFAFFVHSSGLARVRVYGLCVMAEGDAVRSALSRLGYRECGHLRYAVAGAIIWWRLRLLPLFVGRRDGKRFVRREFDARELVDESKGVGR